MVNTKVIKKDNTIQNFDSNKIIIAIKKASDRIVGNLTDDKINFVVNHVIKSIVDKEYVTINELHNLVEIALNQIDKKIADSYKEYRNYKIDFINMMDEVYQESERISYLGDRDNANTDSTTISTQRSLTYNKLSKELYKKFFLNDSERQAINDGYIYIHDIGSRRDSINCCLFDMESVLNGGFEMANLWYNEPNSLDTAFDVIADVTLNASSCQYGGYTICEVDKLLDKYAKKSYNNYLDEFSKCFGFKNFYDLKKDSELYCDNSACIKADEYAINKVRRDFEQGFQGWEMKFNTVGSSRGDFPFISISFGLGTGKFEKMASESILKVRMNGQGKEGFKHIVLFPKLQFLYDENLHGNGKELENLFNLAIQCSSKSCYPDYVSLTGDGYIPSMYKKYGKVVSLMGEIIAHVKLCELC